MQNTAAVVTVIIIVLAIVVIVILLFQIHGTQHYQKVNLDPFNASKTIKEEIIEKTRKDILDPESNSSVLEQIAKENALKNKTIAVNDSVDKKLPQTISDKTVTIKEDKNLLTSETHFDLFTPKEDTVKLYGVTKSELDRLVDEYRREHTYEVEKAPTTLTFNLSRWEEVNDEAQETAANSVVEVRDYQESLVETLYRQESF